MINKVKQYISKNPDLYSDLLYTLNHNPYQIDYASKYGFIVHDLLDDCYFISINSKKEATKILKDKRYINYLAYEKYIYQIMHDEPYFTFHIYHYPSKNKIKLDKEYDIRVLKTKEDKKFLLDNYHTYEDNKTLEGYVDKGRMLGLFVHNKLVGFIGTHEEGSMGLLFVKEEYRRKGYAFALQASLINKLLDENKPIWAEIDINNKASRALQARIGMKKIDESSICWVRNKILVACSGGPDSMALLDMCKDKYEVYVAHVNYHKRKSANRDESIVKDYCKRNNIPFYKKDYKDSEGGNFQDKARRFRYEFFKEVINNNRLDSVYVAHHKDDLIETYIMQTQRKTDVSYYGLRSNGELYGIKVRRPLLKYTKKQLEAYCVKNNIQYGIDESNLTDHYTRNKVRHSIVDKMSNKDKNILVKEINKKNKELIDSINKTNKFINSRNRISVDEFENYDDKVRLLRIFIGINISTKQANELIKEIKQATNFEVLIKDTYLCKEYGYLAVYKKPKNYSYKYKNIVYVEEKYFKLDKKGNSKEGVTLSKDDFPITIRNYRNGDSIKMKYGTKKINRFFIDNKISSKDRKVWPIMLDKSGNAILVPKIGCNINHYSKNHSVYMIKL